MQISIASFLISVRHWEGVLSSSVMAALCPAKIKILIILPTQNRPLGSSAKKIFGPPTIALYSLCIYGLLQHHEETADRSGSTKFWQSAKYSKACTSRTAYSYAQYTQLATALPTLQMKLRRQFLAESCTI
jgi:hypothetical protein